MYFYIFNRRNVYFYNTFLFGVGLFFGNVNTGNGANAMKAKHTGSAMMLRSTLESHLKELCEYLKARTEKNANLQLC